MAKREQIVKSVKHDYVKEFLEAWKIGLGGIGKAAKIYVEIIKVDPKLIVEIHSKLPQIPESVWSTVKRIGYGFALTEIVLGPSNDSAKLSRLDIDIQHKIVEENERFPMLLDNGDALQVDLRQVRTDGKSCIGRRRIKSFPPGFCLDSQL